MCWNFDWYLRKLLSVENSPTSLSTEKGQSVLRPAIMSACYFWADFQGSSVAGYGLSLGRADSVVISPLKNYMQFFLNRNSSA